MMTIDLSEHDDSRNYREEFERSMAAIAAAQAKALIELAEIRAGLKETEKIVKETARSEKVTDRKMRGIRRTFNTQWGRLMEALVEGRQVDVLKGQGIEVEFTRPARAPSS